MLLSISSEAVTNQGLMNSHNSRGCNKSRLLRGCFYRGKIKFDFHPNTVASQIADLTTMQPTERKVFAESYLSLSTGITRMSPVTLLEAISSSDDSRRVLKSEKTITTACSENNKDTTVKAQNTDPKLKKACVFVLIRVLSLI